MGISRASGGSGGSLTSVEPWTIDILPTTGRSATAGTWAVTQSTGEGSSYPEGGSNLQNSSAALNDAISYKIELPAGTYDFKFFLRKASNAGKLTFKVDGAARFSDFDLYAASPAFLELLDTSEAISTAGPHTIQLVMTSKNASSSGYGLGLFNIGIRRTV